MPHGSNKEKASRENQKPNYEGLINMWSLRTKEPNQWPKGVKNCNSRYDTPPKLSTSPYWQRARKLRQDNNDVTQSLKVRRLHCTSYSQGNVMLWRDSGFIITPHAHVVIVLSWHIHCRHFWIPGIWFSWIGIITSESMFSLDFARSHSSLPVVSPMKFPQVTPTSL